jgi:hypothetical protein
MASRPGLPRGLGPDAAHRATVRACRRAARWLGLRDTCLVRSLVVGALLSDRDDVHVHVGFAPGPAGGRVLEGHAWVTVAGQVVGGPDAAMTGQGATTELSIPVRRDARMRRPVGGR